MSDPIVTISNGTLLGKIGTNLDGIPFYAFLGIPYASPPIGSLRFKAPTPPKTWSGIRNAQNESPACIQMNTSLGTFSGSEDCLYLNVFTRQLPDNNQSTTPKPVMFWVHGGSYTSGSNNTESFGPEFLLTEDVVVVVINYRLGIFGFLNFENNNLQVPGNAGMKDMIQALKWVQTNIPYFNGDPNNVTIFGESAGGSAVHYLMLSPLSKGLFHKVIALSGCSGNLWARGKNCANELANLLNMETWSEETVLTELMKMSEEDVCRIGNKVLDVFAASFNRPFAPIIEHPGSEAFISEDPKNIVKLGNYISVPFLTGFNTREGMLYEMLKFFDPSHHELSDFTTVVPYTIKSDDPDNLANTIKDFYFENKEPTRENIDCRYLMEGDNLFVREILKFVKYHADTSSKPIYLYRFSADTKLNYIKHFSQITIPGVCHGDILGYLWKNVSVPAEAYPTGSDENIAIKRLVKLLTNFAKNGNPNPQQTDDLIEIEWQPVSSQRLNFLDFGLDLLIGVNPESKRMAFWEKIFNEYA